MNAYPDVMAGKKILYVHGFASSGSSGTVARIKELLPQAVVTAPDLPIHPAEAMELLEKTCREVQPDLIIGTSMGGMYAEMLYGYDRILMNPALKMGDDILKNNMLGKVTFLNPRADGLKEFIMTKQLQAEYREMTERCFSGVNSEEQQRVWGLFGMEDTVVDTRGLFASHYGNVLRFHGGHRMNDSILIHSVLPVIRWIDDSQEKRQRSIIYISIEETMEHGGQPLPSMAKAFRFLLGFYDIYLVASAPTNDPAHATQMQEWAFENIGVAAYNRLILTNRKDLLYGDYLIDGLDTNGSRDFMSTRIDFGSDTFKTWDDIIGYFGRLGGQ